jgi:hypothetical protein
VRHDRCSTMTVLAEPWVLGGCSYVACRYPAAEAGSRTGEVPDEPAKIDTESTDPIAKQRTLNPLARSARLKRSTRHPTGSRLRDMTGSEASGLRVNRWALIGRRHPPRAALNVPQLHPMKAADLHFRVSPLVADMLGLP